MNEAIKCPQVDLWSASCRGQGAIPTSRQRPSSHRRDRRHDAMGLEDVALPQPFTHTHISIEGHSASHKSASQDLATHASLVRCSSGDLVRFANAYASNRRFDLVES